MAVKLANIKLTQTQQLVLNGVLALVASALTAALSAFIQNYNSGKVDLQSCLLIALGLFCTTFGASLYNFVPAHIVQILQSKDDWIAQLQQSHLQLLTSHQELQETHSVTVNALNKRLQQPVVQNAVRPSQTQNNATVPLVEVQAVKDVEIVKEDATGDTVPRMQAMVAQSVPVTEGQQLI